jgi:hypothetical protein
MKILRSIYTVALILGAAGSASAQTATQTVTFDVTDLSTITVSADPATMSVAAGGTAATNSATTYSVSTNSTTAKKITGYIDAAMPTGTTLTVNLADPDATGAASSVGDVSLTATTAGTAQDLVTGITQLSASGKQISYVLSAGVSAAAATNVSRTVTFTIQ